MANVVEGKVGTSHPVPVSDDEDEGDYKYDSPVGSPKAADKVKSPRQNFISPASSPENVPSKIDDVSENGDSDQEPTANPNVYGGADDNGTRPHDARAEVENVTPPPDESLQPPIVVDDIGIAREMNEYIKVNKINFCELEHLEELWAICDAISAAHSGLPDSLLKDAFLIVLDGHMSRQKQGFLRQHLDYLIKQWKMEVQSEKSAERPTKFIAAGADYTPPVVVKKRRSNAARKRALIGRMGVGEILQQARVLCSTESGDYDVEENEHGSFTIGGHELTFESWGDLTRTKDDGVFYDPTAFAMTRRPRKRKVAAGDANQSKLSEDVSNISTTFSASSSFTSNLNNTTGADVSLASAAGSTVKGKNGTAKRAAKPPKEKDEGELTESDESGGDSDSASSTSSEEDITTMHSKKRRKKRRQTERSTGASSITNIADVVHKAYQYRGQIAHALTFSQKAAFLECLKQQNNGSAGGGGPRLQQISHLMATSKAGASSSPAH